MDTKTEHQRPTSSGPVYKKVLLLGNGNKQGVVEHVGILRPQIEELFEVAAADFSGENDMSKVDADFAIVFGGDGSLLRAVHQLKSHQIPILSVHLGTLGFLSNVAPDDLMDLLRNPEFQKFPIREQILLECSCWRKKVRTDSVDFNANINNANTNNANANDANANDVNTNNVNVNDVNANDVNTNDEICLFRKIVVNEVTLRAGPPFAIIQVELSVDHSPVTIYRGDGVILCTPVGSTAHCLSAGGPILRKDLDVVVICPLNPHTLSNRPVIDSASRIYEFQPQSSEVFLILDGETVQPLLKGDHIVVQKAPYTFRMFRVPGRSYYRTIREKLGWGSMIDGTVKISR